MAVDYFVSIDPRKSGLPQQLLPKNGMEQPV